MITRKKYGNRLIVKEKSPVHFEDWDSRFWIEKIPEVPLRLSSSSSTPILKKLKRNSCLSNFQSFQKSVLKQSGTIQCKSHLVFQKPAIISQKVKALSPTVIQNPNFLTIPNPSKKKISVLSSFSSPTTSKTVKSPGCIEEPKRSPVQISIRTKGVAFKKIQSKITKQEPKEAKKNWEYSDSSSDADEEKVKEIWTCCEIITDELIGESISKASLESAKESFSELISAALRLFSSSIVDKYLTEVLFVEVSSISTLEYEEAKEDKYVESRNNMLAFVVEEEIKKIMEIAIIDKISIQLVEFIICQISLDEIIFESVDETKHCKEKATEEFSQKLIELFLCEDWLDILVEDEINALRIEKTWALLPEKLKKDLNQTTEVKDKLAEYIYFDYLNEIVGGLWLESTVSSYINNLEQSLDLQMPIIKFEKNRQEKRK